ncbi:MAG: hypothetical protein M1827_007024 [Pycnora praestabilis]|nr:MAG: hypothetical protein M1827_007024 [Pycnora praestabilis]
MGPKTATTTVGRLPEKEELLAVLLAAHNISSIDYQAMSAIDGKRTAASFELQFCVIKKRAEELKAHRPHAGRQAAFPRRGAEEPGFSSGQHEGAVVRKTRSRWVTMLVEEELVEVERKAEEKGVGSGTAEVAMPNLLLDPELVAAAEQKYGRPPSPCTLRYFEKFVMPDFDIM